MLHCESSTGRVQGDACALPPLSALGGTRFTVVHGANLLCRLPDPQLFLEALPRLVAPGGLVVFVSPYSWLKQYTPREAWLGAYGACTARCSARCSHPPPASLQAAAVDPRGRRAPLGLPT